MSAEPLAECLTCPQVDFYFISAAGTPAKNRRPYVIWSYDGIALHRRQCHDVRLLPIDPNVLLSDALPECSVCRGRHGVEVQHPCE